jgi:hypothetical protein
LAAPQEGLSSVSKQTNKHSVHKNLSLDPILACMKSAHIHVPCSFKTELNVMWSSVLFCHWFFVWSTERLAVWLADCSAVQLAVYWTFCLTECQVFGLTYSQLYGWHLGHIFNWISSFMIDWFFICMIEWISSFMTDRLFICMIEYPAAWMRDFSAVWLIEYSIVCTAEWHNTIWNCFYNTYVRDDMQVPPKSRASVKQNNTFATSVSWYLAFHTHTSLNCATSAI